MIRKKKFWKTRSGPSFKEKRTIVHEGQGVVVEHIEHVKSPLWAFDSSEDSSSSCDTPMPPTMPQGPMVHGINYWTRVRRKDSVKSSSASSSSSGCLSASSSSSIPSTDVNSSANGAHYHHHIHHHHRAVHAFEAELGPMGTIKRKPNLNLNPIIPLTNTTRILAKHSDDTLVDIDETRPVTGEENGNGQFNRNNVQYGTLRLRRSHTDERLSLNQLIYDLRGPSSMSSASSATGSSSVRTSISPSVREEEYVSDEDYDHHDLPLPPPPPPHLLSSGISTLSLSTLPPPPPEFLDPGLASQGDTGALYGQVCRVSPNRVASSHLESGAPPPPPPRGHPLPLPVPLIGKGKARNGVSGSKPPPPPPVRSDKTRLSQRRLS
ncbi:hypothetical protein HDE_03905 [Halotydeus destructor]|nr:hypothetical protein HDE_03905 [Halotydeus destructor]